MPKFKNREEAHKVHEKYDIDTDREGKYSENDMYCVQKNRLRFILSGIHDDDHVLEVGCNSGGLLRLLSSRKKCYCNGIDISPEMVKRAQDKGFCAVLGAAESLPYPDNTFDSVVILKYWSIFMTPMKHCEKHGVYLKTVVYALALYHTLIVRILNVRLQMTMIGTVQYSRVRN